jgi:hypothetical protein
MQKSNIEFVDCNCSMGRLSCPPFRYAKNAAELQEEMDYCGIKKAIVIHTQMRHGSPIFGNLKILEELIGFENMIPAWAILPNQTEEQPSTAEFYKTMCENHIRALWAFPDEHRYILNGTTFGELFELMIEKKIPLFVKTNPVAISNLLKEFPGLRLIAINLGPHSVERYTRPLIEKYPEFRMETSNYMVDGLIEEFCRLYGPKRLIFGTGFPCNCSGGALMRLKHSDISIEAKRAIAGENIISLLNEVII